MHVSDWFDRCKTLEEVEVSRFALLLAMLPRLNCYDTNNTNTIDPHANTRLDENSSEYTGLAHVVLMFSELHKCSCTMISTLHPHLRWILLKGPKVVLKQGETTLQIALSPTHRFQRCQIWWPRRWVAR